MLRMSFIVVLGLLMCGVLVFVWIERRLVVDKVDYLSNVTI